MTFNPMPWGEGPQVWGSAIRASLVEQNTMRGALLRLVLASEGPPAEELAAWSSPLGGALPHLPLATWLGYWCLQRPLELVAIVQGFELSGAEVLEALTREEREGAVFGTWGPSPVGPGLQVARVAVRYPGGLVFYRAPLITHLGAHGSPDRWRQVPEEVDARDPAAIYPEADDKVQAQLAQLGPGCVDLASAPPIPVPARGSATGATTKAQARGALFPGTGSQKGGDPA